MPRCTGRAANQMQGNDREHARRRCWLDPSVHNRGDRGHAGAYAVVMKFTKAHGAGNDFVVVADLGDELHLSAPLVRALADRRHGIGADGVIRIGAGQRGASVFMDYRNADGGIVEMCGNGVRVVAKHVIDHGLVAVDADGGIRVATRAGVKSVTVQRDADGKVAMATVDMGQPVVATDEVPFVADDPNVLVHDVDVDSRTLELSVVSMGNPHAVIVTDDVSSAPVHELGSQLEVHERFPQRVNVGFVEPVDERHVRLRVWERGVGETAACGTGACAAVVALQRLGMLDVEVDVDLPGGRLTVHRAAGGSAMLTGPAVEVAHGHLDPAWLATVTGTEVIEDGL